ncbi:MAG: stage II sporulation protein D [Syntrophomonadaceae bacterium]|jgi:stage II sporulation protein D
MKKSRLNIRFLIILGLIITTILIAFSCFTPVEKTNEPQITLYLNEEKKVITLPFEAYIIGTVCAEMPASFELEALKAQAVCARTYAIRKIMEGKKYPMGANLSDDIYSCQAYITESEFTKLHHPDAKQYLKKIQRAVNETRGQIMLYDGQPIDALYHSTCGGRTESASEVWGKKVPYLQSAECGYCAESRHYEAVQVFSVQEINSALGEKGNGSLNLKVIEKSPSGRIKKVLINNLTLTGEEIRRRLNLASNWWSYRIAPDSITINTRGYGHGVGLCQYGANGLARDGKRYTDILSHYYQGAMIYKLDY